MPSLKDILASLAQGRLIPIATRQGLGLGDPVNRTEAEARFGASDTLGVFVGPDSSGGLAPAPPIDSSFDLGRMLPFVSSNVEGGYFVRYPVQSSDANIRGDLYLLFQKRRPETPEGRPIGPPRAYAYQNVEQFVWEALLASSSPGGVVHDVIRRGGIEGDRL
jgi:hypothetical protein